MTNIKRTISVILSAVIIFGIAAIMPASAGALVYFPSPTAEDIEQATAEKNFTQPENLRVVSTTENSVTVSWKYDGFGYSLAYTTDASEEPLWDSSVSVRQNDSTEDWKVTVDNLTAGETYYIYVRHAAMEVVKSHLVILSGEYSRIKATPKMNNPVKITTSTAAVSASALKTNNKTVKPVKVSKAKGTVKIVKNKKGTDSKLYKKITVAKKTGAITIKKGTYKKGTYKVSLKISAGGTKKYKAKTVNKTVKIKIK